MSFLALKQRRPTLNAPPGPQGHWPLGTVGQLRRDVLRTLSTWMEQYGDAIYFRYFLDYYGYIFSHPDHNKHILQDNNRNYTKMPNQPNALLIPIVGMSLLTSDGNSWLERRRLVQPAFHRQRIASFSRTMTDAAGLMLEQWQPVAAHGDALDVAEEMMRLTLEIAGKTLFSMDLTREADIVGTAFTAVNRQFRKFSSNPFGLYFLEMDWLPGTRRFKRHMAQLDEVVYSIIGERRRHREQAQGRSDDLLDLLMDARDEGTGEGMDDQQLRDEVMTLLLAGHETTSNALSWTLYLLSEHPDVRSKLEREVDEVIGKRVPSMSDIPNLAYTTMVLEESMRLYPPAYAMARTAREADRVGGFDIEPNAVITLSPYLTHRHPAFWSEPEKFDPERFTKERVAERPRYAYIPFGGGPRLCIGNYFAMTEATLVLAMLTQRYRLHLVPGHSVEVEPLITLRPRYGLRMFVEARSP